MSALNEHLAAAYAAAALRKGDYDATVARAREHFERDPALKSAAQAELTRVKPIPDQRCYVSKVTREFLTAALGGA